MSYWHFVIVSLFITSPTFGRELETIIKSTWKDSKLLSDLNQTIDYASNDRIRRFIPNDPQIYWANQDNSSWSQYGITLPIGLPGKAFALTRVDDARYTATKLEYQATKQELAIKITSAYAECVGSRTIVTNLRSSLNDLMTVESVIQNLYINGKVTQSEMLLAELQRKQLENEIRSEANNSQLACTNLEHLSNETISENSELPVKISDSIITELGTGNESVKRAESDVLVSAAMSDTAFWKSMPDLSFNYTRNYYRLPFASPNQQIWTTSYILQLSIPLFSSFAEARREKVAARITQNRALMEKRYARSEQENSKKEYERLIFRYNEIIKNDLPKAENLLNSSLTYYKTGKLSFAELALARKVAYDLKTEKIKTNIELLTQQLKCLELCKETNL